MAGAQGTWLNKIKGRGGYGQQKRGRRAGRQRRGRGGSTRRAPRRLPAAAPLVATPLGSGTARDTGRKNGTGEVAGRCCILRTEGRLLRGWLERAGGRASRAAGQCRAHAFWAGACLRWPPWCLWCTCACGWGAVDAGVSRVGRRRLRAGNGSSGSAAAHPFAALVRVVAAWKPPAHSLQAVCCQQHTIQSKCCKALPSAAPSIWHATDHTTTPPLCPPARTPLQHPHLLLGLGERCGLDLRNFALVRVAQAQLDEVVLLHALHGRRRRTVETGGGGCRSGLAGACTGATKPQRSRLAHACSEPPAEWHTQ